MDSAPNGASKAPSELFGSFPCQLPWPWPKLRKPLVLSTKAFAHRNNPWNNPWAPCSLARTRRYGAPAVSWCLLCLLMPCHLRNCFEHLALEDRNSPFEFLSQRQRTRILPSCEVWRSPRVCDITQRRAVITLCAKASDVQYMIWYVCLRPMPSWVQFSVKRTCVCPLSTAFWAHHFGSYWACGGARHSRSAIREDGMVADGICTCRNRCNKQRLRRNKLVVKGKRWQGRQEYALYTRAISTYIIIINHIQKIECFP